MRILIKRKISCFCSFLIVIIACNGRFARALADADAPDCARTCLAISRESVMITTFERDVAIRFKAVRAVKHVSLFGVRMPLRMLEEQSVFFI